MPIPTPDPSRSPWDFSQTASSSSSRYSDPGGLLDSDWGALGDTDDYDVGPASTGQMLGGSPGPWFPPAAETPVLNKFQQQLSGDWNKRVLEQAEGTDRWGGGGGGESTQTGSGFSSEYSRSIASTSFS
eukprot:gene17434-23679_t